MGKRGKTRKIFLVLGFMGLICFYGSGLYGSLRFCAMGSTHIGMRAGSICPMQGCKQCCGHMGRMGPAGHEDLRHHCGEMKREESTPYLKCNCKHFLEISKEQTELVGPVKRFTGSLTFRSPVHFETPFESGTSPAPPERPPRIFAV